MLCKNFAKNFIKHFAKHFAKLYPAASQKSSLLTSFPQTWFYLLEREFYEIQSAIVFTPDWFCFGGAVDSHRHQRAGYRACCTRPWRTQ